MRLTPAGFLRPCQTRPVEAETDRLIGETCPGIRLTQEACEGDDHPLWGPLLALRTGASTDPALRHHASSGGALSALLVFLLESKVVDHVVQVAAAETAPIENGLVESRCRADIYRAAGSRYAPSAPLADLERQLSGPERFAFVGKPCDVAATAKPMGSSIPCLWTKATPWGTTTGRRSLAFGNVVRICSCLSRAAAMLANIARRWLLVRFSLRPLMP